MTTSVVATTRVSAPTRGGLKYIPTVAFGTDLDDAKALNALIARIDVERLDSVPPPNLTSAIRQWLFARVGGRQST